MAAGASLQLSEVTKYYKKFRAVDNVSLSVQKGEFLTILGPSGSGKTSLLKLIAGFEEPSEGSIYLNEQDITRMKAFQRNIGMLFQNYALFPHMTVFENIAYPLKIRKWPKADITREVNRVLDLVHLSAHGSRYPKQLSGGQQQRVALARAIVFNPPLLLLDEPLSALDKKLRQQMQLEIKHIQEKVGITTISVTHDQEEALTMSDRICVMNNGRIEQIDTPENLYTSPKNRFVATFIGEMNLLDGKVTEIKNGMANIMIDSNFYITGQSNRSLLFNHTSDRTVCVAVRPENIRIASENGEYQTTLPVTIDEKIYVGEALKVRATTHFGKELLIKLPAVQSSRLHDREVLVGWNSEDVVVIAE
ncbi:ABC transporter ATP-binding protein [Effusibacillus lacus]|uniref:Spermidine/putrescine import ATP-binding protein PotA n=1 Tax=Effusibacillus lacus TaxID=1348429 RepID=A0A292YKH9_9BACL|nr:ABC transporter ATP-binding protein [Effusibacillus lacus]TCS75515.1 putative spermidine/putrescine transport system ATP-binding protein [Effusibacillus lacus]GAX88980.1 ABC transporter ATP-binding protein [Effusibacillus lacus]